MAHSEPRPSTPAITAPAASVARSATAGQPLRVIALGQSLIEHDLRKHPYEGFVHLNEHLRGADIVFSDLETSIRPPSGAVATREGAYAHSADPQVLDCLRELSVNTLALSNNHSFDLGPSGLVQCFVLFGT